jgi:hypothetical protein
MALNTYFRDNDRQARNGTTRIVEWLRNDGFWVTNLEKLNHFQEQDIDLYTYRKDVGATWLELKIDSHAPEKMFLEVIGNDNTNCPGCIYKTKSSHIGYMFEKHDELVMIPTVQLQEWLRLNEHRYPRAKVPTTDAKGNHWYNTIGRIIPVATVLQEVPGSAKLFLPPVCSGLQ